MDDGDIIPGVDDLPLFANEQSKVLDAEIKMAEKRIRETDDDAVENRDRLIVMKEHLRNVGQEVSHTNALVDAKNKEIQSEDHIRQLTKRELGRVRQILKDAVRELEEHQDNLNSVQNNIFKGNERMDAFKLQMNWNQDEIEQWALAAKQKEEDNQALERYRRADEARIKELTLAIEKSTEEAARCKQFVVDEETETQAKQMELDRTAEEFKSLHTERQSLVVKWQEAIEAMRRRDEEIAEIGEKYAEARALRKEREADLGQGRDMLKRQESDNGEVESRLQLLDRLVQKRRQEVVDSTKRLQEFKDELDVLKNELSSSALNLGRKRQQNVTLAREVEAKRVLLEKARKKYQLVKKKLSSEVGNTDKVETSAKVAEDSLNAMESLLKTNENNIAQLKEAIFKHSQQLYALRKEEANLIADINGSQATSKNLQGQIHKLDAESLRQQELIYNAEFQIQQMERKVARGLGERTDEEKIQLQGQIRELEGELDESKNRKKMLTAQCRRLNNELRAARRRNETVTKQRSDLENRIAELELENNTSEITLREEVSKREEMMVQSDVMRLEVRRLREILNAKADEVVGLENRRQQLELSMEERKSEIAVHSDVQKAQLRIADEEKHKVSLELSQRRLAVTKLKAKYESIVKQGKGAGDGEHSQAYYIIQAAQKKEELQREGDELDGSIRKCEGELRAMRATLAHLQARNTEYRSSFQKADMTSDDADELAHLEEQKKLAADVVFRKKKEVQRLTTDVQEDEDRLTQIEEQTNRLEEQGSHLENALRQVTSEVDTQKDQLERMDRKVQRLSRLHREAHGEGSGPTVQERVFEAEVISETSQTVLYTLGQLAKEFPEIGSTLAAQLQTVGLEIPNRPPTKGPRRPVDDGSEGSGGDNFSVGGGEGPAGDNRGGGGGGQDFDMGDLPS